MFFTPDHVSLFHRPTLQINRLHRFWCQASALVVGVFFATQMASAQTITKLNNADTLSSGTSWSGGVTPNSGSIAFFNSTAGSGTWSLGADVTWGRLTIGNVTGAGTISAGNTMTLTALSGLGIDMSAASANWNLLCNVVLGNSQTFSIGTSRTLTIGGTISGGYALTKSGAGLLVLGGNNTYTGNTTLNGGTLTYTVNNTGVKGLIFGAAAGSANVSTLDLTSANVTAGSLTVQTSSSSANTLAIGTGHTLTINGPVTIGQATTDGGTTTLASSGSGSFVMNSAASNFIVGVPQGSYTLYSIVDFSSLSSVSITASKFLLGSSDGTTDLRYGSTTMNLSDTANTINVGTLGVAYNTGQNRNQASTLYLSGNTTIQANTVGIGVGYPAGTGTITFAVGGGTLTLRNQAGTGSITTVDIGNRDYNSTGGSQAGILDLSGGTVYALIRNLYLAQNTGDAGTRTGTATASLVFGSAGDVSSIMSVGTISIAPDPNSGTYSVGTSTGTIDIRGGTFRFGTLTSGSDRGTFFSANSSLLLKGGTISSMSGTAAAGKVDTLQIGGSGGSSITFGQTSDGTGALTFNTTTINVADNTTITANVSTTLNGTITANTKTLTLGGGSGTLTLAGTADNLNNGGTITVNGAELDLNKTAGIDAIAGYLNVSGGTVKLLANNQINDSSAVKLSAGTLNMVGLTDTVGTFTISGGTLAGTGTLTANAYTLTGGTVAANLGNGTASASSGSTALNGTLGALTVNVNGGTLTLGGANRLADTAAISLSAGTLNLSSFTDTVGAFTISGTGILAGTGTLTANSYTLTGGTVNANLGAGTATITTGTTTLNGTVAGSPVNITSGTLALGGSNRLADGATVAVSSTGILDMGANSDTVGTFTMSGGSLNGVNGTLTATTYGLTGGTVNAHLGTGTITVNTGIVTLGSAGRLNAASTLIVSGGTLTLAGAESVAGVRLTGGTIAGAGATLTSSTAFDMQAGVVSAILGGGVALNKTTSGSLTLSGANSFSGGLSVTGGYINFTNDNQLGASGGAISLNGGSLKGATAATIAIASARTITLGSSGGYFSAGSNSSIQINSKLTGSGGVAGFNYDGSGIYILTNTGNDYTGETRIGTQGPAYWTSGSAKALLRMGVDNALPYGPGKGNVIVGYVANDVVTCVSTLDLNGHNTNINGLMSNNPSYAVVDNGSLTAASLTLGNGDATADFGGVIKNTGGALSLVKTGIGTQTLGGANTYSGKTTVQNGTLAFTTGNASATGSQSLGQNGTLDLGVALTSSGVLQYTGSGAATLAKNINILGNGGDTIQNGGTGLLTLSGTVTKTGTTLTLKGGAQGITVTGVIQGNNGSFNSDLVIDGGLTTLLNANTYEGPTFLINGATLNANVADALPTANGRTAVIMDQTGAGNSTLALGADQFIATLTGASSSTVNLAANKLTIGAASGSATFAGIITGLGGKLVKDDASTQVLSGANSYTGLTEVQAGELDLNTTGNNALAGDLTVSGGTAKLLQADQIANTQIVTISGGILDLGIFTDTVGAFNLTSGALNGSGTITASTYGLSGGTVNANLGAGTVTVSTGTTVLNGTAAGSPVVINSGTLALGASDRLADSATVIVAGGVLDMGSYKDTVAGVTLASGRINGAGGSLTSTSTFDIRSGTVSAILAGSVGLTKSTGGTAVLTGNNTYIGATLINGGTLALSGSGSIGNSVLIDVAASATFDVSGVSGYTLGNGQTLQGNGTVVGPVTAMGTVAPGNGVGTLTFSSDFTLANNGTLALELSGNNLDQIVVGGNLTLTGTINFAATGTQTSPAYVFATYGGSLNHAGVTVTGLPSGYTVNWTYAANEAAIVIPEPSALLLVGVGLVGLMLTSRWFRRRNA